jgi:hypothetical protein
MQSVLKHLNTSSDITYGCYLCIIMILGKSPGIVSKNIIPFLHCVDIFDQNVVINCESK